MNIKRFTTEQKDTLIKLLHNGEHSCVVGSASGDIYTFDRRGVKDLYDLLCNRPEILHHAFVADKVVGKGAAAIICAGEAQAIYADVISQSAEALLCDHGVIVQYGQRVPHIINRAGTDICPVEKLCAECVTPAECVKQISLFLQK